MTALLLGLLLLAASEPSAPMEEVASDEHGRFLLETESLRRRGDRVTFRLSFVTFVPRSDGIAEERFEFTMDCRRRTLRMRSGAFLRDPTTLPEGITQHVTTEIRPAKRHWVPIPPGSSQEGVMLRVCDESRR